MERCVTDAAKELGYPEMKPEQLEVAATLIAGRNVFVVSECISTSYYGNYLQFF